MIKLPASRATLAAVLILAIAWAAYTAARQALSDFYAQTTALEVASWSQPGKFQRGDEWLVASDYLSRSLKYSPNSSWALEELAALHLNARNIDRAGEILSGRASYLYFKKALQLRPSSPFIWASIARAKLRMGEVDAELFDALERASRFGPWEAPAQMATLYVGLSVWQQASTAQKQMILAVRDRAMTRDAARTKALLKELKRSDLL